MSDTETTTEAVTETATETSADSSEKSTGIKAKLKAWWAKVVAAVKSSPAVFGYGIVIGLISGLLIG